MGEDRLSAVSLGLTASFRQAKIVVVEAQISAAEAHEIAAVGEAAEALSDLRDAEQRALYALERVARLGKKEEVGA